MKDLSQFFHNSLSKPSFIQELDVTSRQAEELLNARTLIRDRLRAEICAFSKTPAGGGVEIIPRFYTQGSWSYKTLNQRNHVPPQQIDYDDGMYLPVSYLDNSRPSVAAKVYFSLVDSILEKLCGEQAWIHDISKKTCSRIVISKTAHVDVPLYSIPDSEFKKLMEKAAAGARSVKSMDSAYEFAEVVWAQIASEKVLLAMRDGDWEVSDPRKLHDWFVGEVRLKGEQLRRLCRYLKAWRDYLWVTGGPSSIFLTVCATELFTQIQGRDDLALLAVLKGLPERLRFPVLNPTDNTEDLSKKVNVSDMPILIQQSRFFTNDLTSALSANLSLTQACDLVRKNLGERFPTGWDEVKSATGTVLRDTVASYPNVALKEKGSTPWMSP